MFIQENFSIQELHTFHIPVKTRWFAEYESIEELKVLLQMDIVKNNLFFHIGGGSNLLFTKDYPGVIIHSKIRFIETVGETSDEIFIEVGSGIVWDDFVAWCVDHGYGGAENLSYIPGEVGASAIQNIGAYGAEVKDIIERVETVDIKTGKSRIFTISECKYGYRSSIFKQSLKGKYIVTSVVFRLNKKPVLNLDYGNIREAFENMPEKNLRSLREAIISIRKKKLPEPDELGSAGSFFMNPVISLDKYVALKQTYPDMPHYPMGSDRVKIPAAWLIDRCGWKGKTVGGAAVYDKQCLVIVNKNEATSEDVIKLSQMIQESVSDKYGISIQPEVNFI